VVPRGPIDAEHELRARHDRQRVERAQRAGEERRSVGGTHDRQAHLRAVGAAAERGPAEDRPAGRDDDRGRRVGGLDRDPGGARLQRRRGGLAAVVEYRDDPRQRG